MTRFSLTSAEEDPPSRYVEPLREAGFTVDVVEQPDNWWAATVCYIEIETAADMIRAIETARAHNPAASGAIVLLESYADENVPGFKIYDGYVE